MGPTPLIAVYVKTYPYGVGTRDTRLLLVANGVFEEELDSSDADLLTVGEWEIVKETDGCTVVLRTRTTERRYHADAIWGSPPRYASGIEADTGMEARLYRLDEADEPKPSDVE